LINCSSANKYYSFVLVRVLSYSLDLIRLTSDNKSFTSFKGWYVCSRACERRTITQLVIPWPIRGTSVRHVWRLLFDPLHSLLIREMDANSTWLVARDDFSTLSSTFCELNFYPLLPLSIVHACNLFSNKTCPEFVYWFASITCWISSLYRVSYFFFIISIGNQFFFFFFFKLIKFLLEN